MERTHDLRADPFDGTQVHVVGTRQKRPNLPSTGCPFCVGGLEAPEPYDVRSFSNRWPAMPGDRCEVVLYTPEHDATFQSLGTDGSSPRRSDAQRALAHARCSGHHQRCVTPQDQGSMNGDATRQPFGGEQRQLGLDPIPTSW